jgi:DNA-binding response OmpR family regulator
MFGLKSKEPKVLVVDDEAEILMTLVERLDFNGLTVFAAANGYEGLSKTIAHAPDIIITDINMPHMNGFEMIKAIRAADTSKNIPVIVISGSTNSEHKKEALRLGAEYLTKPFEMSELLGKIESLLELSIATASSH